MLRSGEIHVGICHIGADWLGEKVVLAEDCISILSNAPIDLSRLPEMPMIKYTPNSVLGI